MPLSITSLFYPSVKYLYQGTHCHVAIWIMFAASKANQSRFCDSPPHEGSPNPGLFCVKHCFKCIPLPSSLSCAAPTAACVALGTLLSLRSVRTPPEHRSFQELGRSKGCPERATVRAMPSRGELRLATALSTC